MMPTSDILSRIACYYSPQLFHKITSTYINEQQPRNKTYLQNKTGTNPESIPVCSAQFKLELPADIDMIFSSNRDGASSGQFATRTLGGMTTITKRGV